MEATVEIGGEVSKDSAGKKYDVEGTSIHLGWKEFNPSKGPAKAGKAVIFLTGWAVNEKSKSIQDLSQGFADSSQAVSYAVQTRAEKPALDSLEKEAEAVKRFIKEKGISEVILAGHSQGGIKAADLAVMLQEEEGVKVDGLILMESVGLYNQTDLTSAFIKDAGKTLVNSTATVLGSIKDKHPSFDLANKGSRAGIDIAQGILKEAANSTLHLQSYKERLAKEVAEMSRANPKLREVKVPVVMVQAAQDLVSNIERIVPPYEVKVNATQEEDGMNRLIEQRKAREAYIKQNYFPNSPDVSLVVPTKIPHHGLPLFRSQSVANAAIGLLERSQRPVAAPQASV